MRRIVGPLLIAGLILVTSGSVRPSRAQDVTLVSMNSDLFAPIVITINAGATVVWSNDEPDPRNSHNIIIPGLGIESPLVFPGEAWSFTSGAPGTFEYFCDLHEGMVGQLIVQ